MSKTPPAPPGLLGVQGWFLKNGLPWDVGIEIKLSESGVECLEHIKVFESQKWDAFFDDDCYTKVQKRLAKSVLKKLEKEGDVDPEKCATKMIICQAALKHPPQTLHTSSSVTSLKPQRTKPNTMGFTQSVRD